MLHHLASQVETGKETEKEINVARELYRKQATEGAMLYFLLTKLCMIDHMYQYSLDSFVTFFLKSISKAAPAEHIEQRVLNLREGQSYYLIRNLNRLLRCQNI